MKTLMQKKKRFKHPSFASKTASTTMSRYTYRVYVSTILLLHRMRGLVLVYLGFVAVHFEYYTHLTYAVIGRFAKVQQSHPSNLTCNNKLNVRNSTTHVS
jgi:hypothetical protein